jgi:malate dehydrogenase (quinone)
MNSGSDMDARILNAPDIVLVGSGIMSATLAVMLKRLDPKLRIQVVEITPELAQEASNGWNNAGTGHAALCELSYTPEVDRAERVSIGRALHIFEQFEHSKQFWGSATAAGVVEHPADFIHAVPHICFVTGRQNVELLHARHTAMSNHHFFRGMTHTTDPAQLHQWMPLVMEGREPGPVAATSGAGTEVNFGLLARKLCTWITQQADCGIALGWKVTRLQRGDGEWRLTMECQTSGETRTQRAKFIFVGAGGGTLPLLQSTGLPEVANLAAFPVGGQWLVCDEPAVCSRHNAKVYGVADPAAPHVGTPHLDQRRLDGRCQLLFGPFASWTTRFLKQTGAWSDLPLSIRAGNLSTLLRAGLHNLSLVRYLVTQGLQSMEERMKTVRHYYPDARTADWRLVQAGIRVQTIKKADRGAVYFGTEVFSSSDRSISALLGASPGASVSVNIALEVIKTCLPHLLSSDNGKQRMRQMIPTFDCDLKQAGNASLFEKTSREAMEQLHLPCNS